METHPKLLSSFLDSEAGCFLEFSDCMVSGAQLIAVLVQGGLSTLWDSLQVVKESKERKCEKVLELKIRNMLGLYINTLKTHSNGTIHNSEK